MGALFSCFDAAPDKVHTASLNVSGSEVCQCLDFCLHKTRNKDMVQLTTQETSHASSRIHDNFSSYGGESAAVRPTPSDIQQNACSYPESRGDNFTNSEITPDRCASGDHSRVRPESILRNVIPLNSETTQENKRIGSDSEKGCPDQNSDSCVVTESNAVGSYFSFPMLEDKDVCATCLDEYDDENPKITVKCLHHFHLGCIYDWMERSPTCPICRELLLFGESS